MATGKDTQLGADIAVFHKQAPLAPQILRYLRESDATVIAADHDPKTGIWALRLKLRESVARRFGLTRYLLCVHAGDDHLELDDIETVTHILKADPEVEQEIVLVITGDSQASAKIRDWAVQRSHGLTVVPLPEDLIQASSLEGRTLESVLAEWVMRIDPYLHLLPVTGPAFFGRRTFLRMMDERVSAGEHLGIFGLRKIGKTSLLLEFNSRVSARSDWVTVVADVQASAAANSAAHVAFNVGTAIATRASERSTMTEDRMLRAMHLPERWSEVAPEILVSDVCDAIRKLLTDGILKSSRVVIILDEIELLLGERGRSPMPLAVEFLRGLRAISQGTRRLSLVLAGVNASPLEAAAIADADNPLFNFVGIEYLGPLERAAGRQLIKTIGEGVGIAWRDGPLDVLIDGVGAHPLLMRLGASRVTARASRKPYRPSRADVREILESFHRDEAATLREIIESLERFYPEELELLEFVARGDHEVVTSWQQMQPEALNHLAGYGVVDSKRLQIKVPVLGRFLEMQAGAKL